MRKGVELVHIVIPAYTVHYKYSTSVSAPKLTIFKEKQSAFLRNSPRNWLQIQFLLNKIPLPKKGKSPIKGGQLLSQQKLELFQN